MKSTAYPLAGALALIMTLVSGTIHGRLTNRWGIPPDLAAAGARLASIPTEFGDWRMVSQEEIDADTQSMLQCSGSIYRVYRNVGNPSQPSIQVAMVVGPGGPISVHTPEICYSSRDYAVDEHGRRHLSIPAGGDSPEHQFWGLRMKSKDPTRADLRVCYGWSTGGQWQAPERPRFAFSWQPLLYKIQLAAPVMGSSPSAESDPCADFLRDFLPVLNSTSLINASK